MGLGMDADMHKAQVQAQAQEHGHRDTHEYMRVQNKQRKSHREEKTLMYSALNLSMCLTNS